MTGSNQGRAFVICGNSVTANANNCGESTFDREANFWLANDYYNKAADVGVSVSREQFLNRFPTPEECFKNGITLGDHFLLDCWNEKTIVR